MFQEDCCLQCGKPCVDGRVYCSSACEDLDAPPALSPSHSTASSALSSPYLSPSGHSSTPSPSSLSLHSHPIPPLVLPPPTKVSHRLPMWYDSDDDPIQDHDQHDAVQVHHPLPPQLSYARRPAATNTRSTIPLLASSSGSRSASTSASVSGSRSVTQHRRTSSRSTTATTTTTESSSMPSSPADDSYHLARPHHHHQHEHQAPGSPSAPSSFASSARKRANRSSLPAHFRLLASPTLRPTRPSIAVPSLSSPTGRPSPSTPKLARPHVDATPVLAGASPASAPLALSAVEVQVEVEESRGRRRIPGIRGGSGAREASTSRSRRRTRSRSRSVSRSRGRWAADGNGGEDESRRGRRRTARADGWTGTTEYGFGVGRTGLMAREAEVLRR